MVMVCRSDRRGIVPYETGIPLDTANTHGLDSRFHISFTRVVGSPTRKPVQVLPVLLDSDGQARLVPKTVY